MIKYALKCTNDHCFESWFQSASAFDSLRANGHLSCPTCGSTQIEKALMTPKLCHGTSGSSKSAPVPTEQDKGLEKALKDLKATIEANSDYVGDRFAEEARAIHLDEAPSRPIHGEANAKEAKALVEDGIPVMPLPFRSARNSN